jgi:uncharacterized protein (DUF1015 family)
MAEIRPFAALRYAHTSVDIALNIAPPYDVISPAQQELLYERSPHNIVRIEYGARRQSDSERDNRYTRARDDLARWRGEGVLTADEAPSIYDYTQEFSWAGRHYTRQAYVVALRLEPWETGAVKPHERTLSNPKADRLELLRATRTQVSPVYAIYRERKPLGPLSLAEGRQVVDCEIDEQRHTLRAISDRRSIDAFASRIAHSDIYIADGHHRYETALAYRDEVRARSSAWTGDEPENFVLMALTHVDDPGLVVLPTHRIVAPPSPPPDALDRIAVNFAVHDLGLRVSDDDEAGMQFLMHGRPGAASFLALGLVPGHEHLLTLRNRAAVEALMPAEQPPAWKRLDVNVLQYGILRDVYRIDDDMLAAGGAVTYAQRAHEAQSAVASGAAAAAFLMQPTTVAQVLDVADAGAKMPQKSTYFYPKLPTGLVLRPLGD